MFPAISVVNIRVMKLEICAASVESAIEAQLGGADRIELCENLNIAGTTPSYGTIKTTREKLHIGLNVMIRPRGGDFLYSDTEFEIMKKDTVMCREIGADGIVAGILLEDGNVDKERMKILVDLARPMTVTFHRAFDMTPDPFKAMDDIISLGVERILTAGQKTNVTEGIELLAKLVTYAGNRIIIMPGSGINAGNVEWVRDQSKANEFHTTAKRLKESRMQYRKEGLTLYLPDNPPDYHAFETDAATVSRIRELLK